MGKIMDLHRPGETIRATRRRLGLTLSQVSTRSGLSTSTLSKLERGHTSLSYDKLRALSDGMGLEIGELLDDRVSSAQPRPMPNARRVVERADEGGMVDAGHGRQRLFATELLSRRMTPTLTEPRARTIDEFMQEVGGLVRHADEEFALVLQGEVEFHSEIYAPLRLAVGDSIYFDGDMGHAYLQAGVRPCLLMTVRATREAVPGTSARHASLAGR